MAQPTPQTMAGPGRAPPLRLGNLPKLSRPRVVFGPDDRQLVPDTGQLPYRVICYLEIHFPLKTEWGTGTLIGKRSLATAGHCVYNAALGGGAQLIRIIPGAFLDATGALCAPYGYADVDVSVCQYPPGWPEDSKASSISRWDYAVIVLPANQPFGQRLGYMALNPFDQDSDAWLRTYQEFYNSGYPVNDKPVGSQWWTGGPLSDVDDQRLYYTLDTSGGESGSPIYYVYERLPDGTPLTCLVGIHTTGAEGSLATNSAIRSNSGVYADLKRWSP